VITGSASGTAPGESRTILVLGKIDVSNNGWVFIYGNDLASYDVTAVVVCT
jgi:hypothetical protein